MSQFKDCDIFSMNVMRNEVNHFPYLYLSLKGLLLYF